MYTNLKGRVALVTGSSQGLGKAIAMALAQESADVIINGRWSKTVGATAYEIEHKNNHDIKAYQLACDATNPDKIIEAFSEKMSSIGHLDILVNNVGNITTFGKFEDLSDEDWQKSFDLSFMSTVRFTRVSLPYLKKSDQARIINISSLPAHQPGFTGLNPHYGVAKAGLVNLTKNLANDLGRYGITVNAVCPSTLSGGGWLENVKDRAKRQGISVEEAESIMRLEESNKSPLNKVGGLEDVANLVVYLSSHQANFLTGHCYNVDGGITRGI
jgi:3-oxoacyl-[acyl-carrier protein] reductase